MFTPYRPHLAWLLLACGLPLAAIAITNLLVDPYGIYDWLPKTRLADYRNLDDLRIFYAEDVLRESPHTLLLGSSRTEVAMDPRLPAWGGNAYNIGIRGMVFEEMDAIVRYLLEESPPESIYLFVDFYMFNDLGRTRGKFFRSRFAPGLSTLDYYLFCLLSQPSLTASLNVLGNLAKGQRFATRIQGYKPRSREAAQGTRQLFAESIRYYLSSEEMYARFGGTRDNLRRLADLLATVRASGVKLTLAILPLHALQMETLRQAGLWKQIENWKRDLAAVLTAEAREAGVGPVVLWDFGAYRMPSTEPLPTVPGAYLRWFVDSAHPSPAFGALVAARIRENRLGDVPVAAAEPVGSTPGARVDAATVSRYLAGIRRDRESYLASHSPDVSWYHGIVAETQ